MIGVHGRKRSVTHDITVAVVGNPNVGKSTLFNVITGELSHVSNWPGTTVTLEEGYREWMGVKIRFVDLPGTYGLGATSLEEVVTREYIVSGDADVILVLVDSTAPERTLYLPIQVLELTSNVIIAFTKVDEMDKLGIHINFAKLSSMLGIPVIPVSAVKNIGIRELLNTIVSYVQKPRSEGNVLRVDYGDLEPFIDEISTLVARSKTFEAYNTRWVAIRLLEGDVRLEELLMSSGELDVLRKIQIVREAIRRSIGRDPVELIINARFNFVAALAKEVIVRVKEIPTKSKALYILGEILQSPVLGPITSLTVLFLMFSLIFSVNTGFPLNLILNALGLTSLAEALESYNLSRVIGLGINVVSELIRDFIPNEVLASLIADGILVGVGAVITFLPLIFLAFLAIAALEDSGLAPRMAVGFHSVFSRFGLSGRAIYPLLLGLGCNVPAVMASRTSIDDIERREIIVATPFIPCQARLIVTMAFLTAYVDSPLKQALVLVIVYAMGITYYLLTSLIVRRLMYRVSETPELVLELPLIHVPKVRIIWWISWEYTKHFIRKAGLIILVLSVIVWSALTLGPNGFVADVEESFLGIIGKTFSPLLTPMKLTYDSSWKMTAALIQGFIAKEAVLETLAILEGTADVGEALASLNLSLPQVLALLIFINSYVPCMATLAVVYQEAKNLKYVAVLTTYMIIVAYISSLITYMIAEYFTMS